MKRPTLLTITVALLLSGCSLILDFDVGTVDCWCGERWETSLYGAEARRQGGDVQVIAPELTTHIACVSMLEHLVLDFGDPNNPTYQSLVAGFEAQAIANCEQAVLDLVPPAINNNCDSNQVTLVVEHNGACWRSVNYDETDCSQHTAECIGKYDCAEPWIEVFPGNAETGGDVEWECDEDPGIGAGPLIPDRELVSPN